MAMESLPSLVDFPIKTFIDKACPTAKFDYRRVYPHIITTVDA